MSSRYYYQKDTKSFVIEQIRYINNELQLKPRLSTSKPSDYDVKHFKSILENYLTSFGFREHEGNGINDTTILAFVNRMKKEAEEQEEEEEEVVALVKNSIKH